VFYMLAN